MQDDLELHAVGLAFFMALPAMLATPDHYGRLVGYAFLALAILVPQGRLWLKAQEYTWARRKRYLLLNEGIVFGIASFAFGIWWVESLLGVRTPLL